MFIESEPNRSQPPRLVGITFLMVAMGITIVLLVVVVGVWQRLIANHAYAYELMLQKFLTGGGAYWLIIELPLGSDPSQQ